MAKRRVFVEGLEPLSRKRTADMLRQLRMLTREVRMLKAQFDAAAQAERRGRTLRVPPKRQAH